MVFKLSLKNAGELDRERRWPGPLGRGHLMDKGLEMGTDECMHRDGEGERKLRLRVGLVSYLGNRLHA